MRGPRTAPGLPRLLLAGALLGGARTAAAQASAAADSAARTAPPTVTLHQGTVLRIALVDSAAHVTGNFVRLDSGAVELAACDGCRVQRIPRARVATADAYVRDVHAQYRHALVGGMLGTVAGMVIGAQADRACNPSHSFCANGVGEVVYGTVGLFGGTGIGALLPAGAWRRVALFGGGEGCSRPSGPRRGAARPVPALPGERHQVNVTR